MADSKEIPSKLELVTRCPKDPFMSTQASFDDLRDCSEPFQKAFLDAWKAITNGSLRKLEDAVSVMKSHACWDCPNAKTFLNVCYLQSAVTSGKPTLHYMTLLSHAAVNRKKGMVKYLQENGANSYIGNSVSGSTLTQMLIYASIFNCPNVISIEIVQMLSKVPLNDINVFYYDKLHSPIELAIDLKRFDIAKLLVQMGAKPYVPVGDKALGAMQLLGEYYKFGTNQYLTWLLHEHLLSDDLPDFIDTVVNLDILSGAIMKKFAGVGRHPAHAILTCGHEDMIRKFIERHGTDCLLAKDNLTAKRSALQIAAEKGDIDTTTILINMGKEFDCADKTDMAAALLTASRGNHSDIVKLLLLTNISVIPDITERMEDLTCAYEALHAINPDLLLKFPIAHYAARHGMSRLFKVVFPLPLLGDKMFAALTTYNSYNYGKTPVEVAIENNHLCILKTLQERIVERESHSSAKQSLEEKVWEKLWSRVGNHWFLHACTHGSVDAVKFFVEEMGCSVNYQGPVEGETPLTCASSTGKDEIIEYLLHYEGAKICKDLKKSPLLIAAENGFARCVELLLSEGADVNDVCPYTNYNSLMLAIAGKHTTTALAILCDKKQGLKSLQFRCGDYKTPMRMLIEHMPSLAEWVLNNVALDTAHQSEEKDVRELGGYFMDDKFELVEDFQSPKRQRPDSNQFNVNDWRPECYDLAEHPLKLMVDCNRENLLHHPLVTELIEYKWRRIAIPGFLIYLFVYLVYLILLTAFAICLPFPSDLNSTYVNVHSNTTDALIQGVNVSIATFLYSSAVICCIFSIIYLLIEVTQLFRRGFKYLQEFENYVQVFLCLLALLFVFPVGHDNWSLPSWRWQIGAIAVFLGWLNSIILLKSMPYFGVNITMLFNVGYNFLLLIYLPILLILTFGFPLYMLLAFDPSYFEKIIKEKGALHNLYLPTDMILLQRTESYAPPLLLLYDDPGSALWDVFVQTAGYIDSLAFLAPYLSYPALTAIMYITLVFAMPILFNSFLIGVAVGSTDEERDKANFTIIKEKLSSAFELETSVPLLRHVFYKRWKGSRKIDEHWRREFELKNKAIRQEIAELAHVENLKRSVTKLTKQVNSLKENLSQTRAALSKVQENVSDQIVTFGETFKRDLAETKEMVRRLQPKKQKRKPVQIEAFTVTI